MECIGSDERRGSLTAVGAVSPPGGDLSEPVSQATMRIVKVFWALDASLAYKRHFPAINWLNSYSLYLDSLKPWFDENLGEAFMRNRTKAMSILQNESSLNEIVQLVGKDALSPADQLTLEVARMVREAAPPKELIVSLHEPLTGAHVGPGMLALFFLGDGR
mgnify:CR=1 FL=1